MQHVCTRTPEHTCCTPSHMRVNTHTALAGSERQSGHGADAKRLDANAIAQGKAKGLNATKHRHGQTRERP